MRSPCFCLYAEDAGIFGEHDMFHDYLERFEVRDLRRALIDLFKVLDQKPAKRDPYLDKQLAAFPYVNGGLFEDENIEIPNFTEEIRDLLLQKHLLILTGRKFLQLFSVQYLNQP